MFGRRAKPEDQSATKTGSVSDSGQAAGSRWPYGVLVAVMLSGAGLMVVGLTLQEIFAPGLWVARQSWIPSHPSVPSSQPAPVRVRTGSVDDLRDSFRRIGYELPAGGAGEVPRLSVAGLPDDLSDLEDAKERKTLFLQTILPMVLSVNEELRSARSKVVALSKSMASGEDLDDAEADWLGELEQLFRIERKGEAPAAKALLKRLDEVPVGLALAQAAIESGWGTSRFAREGNALFGQRTWTQDDGLVPKNRQEGESFRVRRFDSPADSVWVYVHNLNTAPAYAGWRARRAALRAAGQGLSATALLSGLEPYSEKGADYLAMLDQMIRKEKLGRFQKTKLATPWNGDEEAVASAD